MSSLSDNRHPVGDSWAIAGGRYAGISRTNQRLLSARRYITTSLKREFASDSGTELNAALPKMSPLNPQYLTKKQSVFQKIAEFVEKFKGVGGVI